MDNVKDTYHASLLHLFFTRFRINRLTQKGGVFVSEDGAHHCTYTEMVEDKGDAYEKGGMRSAGGAHDFQPGRARRCSSRWTSSATRVSIQILSLFPGFVLHQIRNSLAARQVVPKGIDRTELALDALRLRRRRRGDDCAGACCRRTSSARPATSRWRTAPPPASCSAASPPRAIAPR